MTTETLFPTKDTFVNEYEPDTNYGSLPLVNVYTWWDFGVSAFYYNYGYSEFDLGNIEPEEITSAILKFRIQLSGQSQDKPASTGMSFQKVNPDLWAEDTLTWNNKPPFIVSAGTIPFDCYWDDQQHEIEFDITSMVKEVGGLLTGRKLSFEIRTIQHAIIAYIMSKEAPFDYLQPKLEITYAPAAKCGQPVRVVDKDNIALGIRNLTVAAQRDGLTHSSCSTGSDGRCEIQNLVIGQSYDIKVVSSVVGYKCEYPSDCEYDMQTACDPEITLKLKEEVSPPCEYTGHASDAKFVTGAWVYPERALEGTKADVVIAMDVLQVGETRYKFMVTREWDGIVEESTAFLKGYFGHYADTYHFTMPDQDATLTIGLYRCNESGEWELCPGTTFPGGPTEHTITIVEGAPIFEWICWRTLPYVPLAVNQTIGVVEGKATIQAGVGGCLIAHRVDGVVPITIKNLTTEKEMIQNTDADGYLYFEFPLADCVEGENEFQLVSGEVSSETKTVNTLADVVIGKIISCPTEVPAGDYGVFGWDLKVPVKVQNQGGKTGEFRVYFMNITTGKKEDVDPPDLPFPLGWWDNIGAGKTKEYTLESSSVLTEGMELEMQLWQQEKWESGGEPDDVVKITVGKEVVLEEFPIKQVALYGGLALGLYGGGSIASTMEHPTAKTVGTVAKVGAVIPAIAGIYYVGRWAANQFKKL